MSAVILVLQPLLGKKETLQGLFVGNKNSREDLKLIKHLTS